MRHRKCVILSTKSLRSSMQTRALEEAVALARLDAQVHGLAVAINRDRHFDAGLALRPDAAEEACEVAHFLAGNRKHDVAVTHVGLLGRSLIGEPDDDEPVLHLGGVEPDPGPWRSAAPAGLHEVVEDRI